MKKFFATVLLLSTLAVSSVFAQFSAQEILDNYNKLTNYKKIENRPLMLEMALDMQGQKITIKMIAQNQNKQRSEMNAMGMTIVTVLNDNQGWVSVPGQGVQELPADKIAQAKAKTVGILSQYLKSGNEIAYVENKTINGIEYYILSSIDKDTAEVSLLFFNVKNSLLERVETNQNGMVIVMEASEYKDFDGVKIPTFVKSNVDGKDLGTMTITKFELDYPTAAWMFAKPQ